MKAARKILFDYETLKVVQLDIRRPLVFTNGVFDILHRGHVEYLERAAELGSTLLVGLNSDASVRTLGKGEGRPFNKVEDRAFVVAGLMSVDLVVVFEEATPEVLLQELRPEVYVKGGDYSAQTLKETDLVKSWGGEVKIMPYVLGFSTTSLVKRLRK